MNKVFLADGVDGSDHPGIMQLALGEYCGKLLAVFTDNVAPFLEGLSDEQQETLVFLTHVGSVQKCLADSRLESLTGLPGTEIDRLAEELLPSAFSQGEAVVDGVQVAADLLGHRGLDFVLGHDVHDWPFVMLRPMGLTAAWPQLRSVRLIP